ncbi:CDP-6-deoxy-D-xylo-4-hexulose-3-dehydrase [Saccharopolyspora lacisalsi]|uniref:CDP-6-deoxy-D-xylo-4-hexulose-3-dehydrase n=1 Tax=Halosaccharopolyspora lacisalsi TaxID=1000566 RepID=A0A839E6K1_9PSEU|nr:lipopolysaccharide biosynthesis protein RfbH [Halosaccharopolyspora lacisalsi]MBA8827515.1 CDP-6-deoxy-D-xylo-4-hexulose-3-dehydrase [Halosaccharopolyspora lacisalsi]
MSEQERTNLLRDVAAYHRSQEAPTEFVPGETPVLSSGAVLDEADRVALAGAAIDLRIAAGTHAQHFESEFARTVGRRKALLTNSGSSANLLAISALTSPRMGDGQLRPGDEVITAAAGFPTTVNPVLQNGLVPVFVDIELGTYNTTAERVAAAIGPRTKAIALAHTLGNPYEATEIAKVANDNGLFLIEDNCDALGSTYRGRNTGTFGDASTVSFYPAHHITTGEGGCVLSSNMVLAGAVESMRDWGRDCWCKPGEDNRCTRRFDYQLGELPRGYDHKYTYSHIGYNLKTTDLQAALGRSQLQKLPEFGKARRENWNRLSERLDGVPGLMLPRATPHSDPSWFGFAITVLPEANFTRRDMLRFLEDRKIATRQLFAGNITRHPAYTESRYRVSETLTNSDIVTERSFWLGVYPGLSPEAIDYVADTIREYVALAR